MVSLVTGFLVSTTLFGYASATAFYLPVWRDGLSLWKNAVDRVPQLPVVQIQWADALHDSGQIERAIIVLEEMLQSGQPDDPDRKRSEDRLAQWHSEIGSNTLGEVRVPADRENREILVKGI